MGTDRLDWYECVAAVRELEGRVVAVRIAMRRRTEELVAVFHGELGALTEDAKRPSLFWPLGAADRHPEQPGLYLHEPDFVGGQRRAGGIVVIEQADVVVNVRPLGGATRRDRQDREQIVQVIRKREERGSAAGDDR
jgi:hypothetical protein